MNMQSVDGKDTWAQFLKLTNQARARNAGFDLPLTPQRTVGSGENKKLFTEVLSGMPRAGKLYDTAHNPRKRQSILGTRFDGYA
jgi:hypothetical protein